MKYITYLRLSKEDKTRTQHGFDSQRRDISIYLEMFEGSEIIAEFSEYVSGAADVKPELEKAIELCKETGATLLISKVDRLSRRVSQVTAYLEGEVPFKVACMPNADNFQITIYAALAEQERAFIRERTKRGLEVAKAKGVKLGGANDKWKNNFHKNKASHKKNPSYTKVREEQKPLVNRVKQMMNDTNNSLTQNQMVVKLNAEGWRTVRGNNITQGTLSNLIKKYIK